jgi:dTDP-glucose 4,6-dehydratase
LGWKAADDFERGLGRTSDWYLANRAWWEALRAAKYAGQRLGTQGDDATGGGAINQKESVA